MSFQRDAEFGLAGRHALVHPVESWMTLKAAAAAFSVSPATPSLVASLARGRRVGAAHVVVPPISRVHNVRG